MRECEDLDVQFVLGVMLSRRGVPVRVPGSARLYLLAWAIWAIWRQRVVDDESQFGWLEYTGIRTWAFEALVLPALVGIGLLWVARGFKAPAHPPSK